MKHTEVFEKIIEEQLARIERIKQNQTPVDYTSLDKIIIGVIGGDGIGPTITAHARRVLEEILKEEILAGKVEFRTIDGCTIENRHAAGKAIPDDVLEEIKSVTCC